MPAIITCVSQFCCQGEFPYLSYLSYLSLEQSSLHAAHIHKCDDLISSVFLRVWRLIVSVNSWLWMRLAAPRRSHLLPSPRSHPFSITTSRVWEGAVTLLVLNHSLKDISTPYLARDRVQRGTTGSGPGVDWVWDPLISCLVSQAVLSYNLPYVPRFSHCFGTTYLMSHLPPIQLIKYIALKNVQVKQTTKVLSSPK